MTKKLILLVLVATTANAVANLALTIEDGGKIRKEQDIKGKISEENGIEKGIKIDGHKQTQTEDKNKDEKVDKLNGYGNIVHDVIGELKNSSSYNWQNQISGESNQNGHRSNNLHWGNKNREKNDHQGHGDSEKHQSPTENNGRGVNNNHWNIDEHHKSHENLSSLGAITGEHGFNDGIKIDGHGQNQTKDKNKDEKVEKLDGHGNIVPDVIGGLGHSSSHKWQDQISGESNQNGHGSNNLHWGNENNERNDHQGHGGSEKHQSPTENNGRGVNNNHWNMDEHHKSHENLSSLGAITGEHGFNDGIKIDGHGQNQTKDKNKDEKVDKLDGHGNIVPDVIGGLGHSSSHKWQDQISGESNQNGHGSNNLHWRNENNERNDHQGHGGSEKHQSPTESNGIGVNNNHTNIEEHLKSHENLSSLGAITGEHGFNDRIKIDGHGQNQTKDKNKDEKVEKFDGHGNIVPDVIGGLGHSSSHKWQDQISGESNQNGHGSNNLHWGNENNERNDHQGHGGSEKHQSPTESNGIRVNNNHTNIEEHLKSHGNLSSQGTLSRVHDIKGGLKIDGHKQNQTEDKNKDENQDKLNGHRNIIHDMIGGLRHSSSHKWQDEISEESNKKSYAGSNNDKIREEKDKYSSHNGSSKENSDHGHKGSHHIYSHQGFKHHGSKGFKIGNSSEKSDGNSSHSGSSEENHHNDKGSKRHVHKDSNKSKSSEESDENISHSGSSEEKSYHKHKGSNHHGLKGSNRFGHQGSRHHSHKDSKKGKSSEESDENHSHNEISKEKSHQVHKGSNKSKSIEESDKNISHSGSSEEKSYHQHKGSRHNGHKDSRHHSHKNSKKDKSSEESDENHSHSGSSEETSRQNHKGSNHRGHKGSNHFVHEGSKQHGHKYSRKGKSSEESDENSSHNRSSEENNHHGRTGFSGYHSHAEVSERNSHSNKGSSSHHVQGSSQEGHNNDAAHNDHCQCKQKQDNINVGKGKFSGSVDGVNKHGRIGLDAGGRGGLNASVSVGKLPLGSGLISKLLKRK